MNKKGMVFATFTVMIIFLFIISNIIYKMHTENNSKLKDVGLGTVDLLRQRGDSEFSNLVSEKEIELKVNDALVKFANGEGKSYLNDNSFNEMFFQYLKRDSNFLDYDFNLVGNILEFNLKKTAGKINNIEECKKKVVELAEEQVGCKYVLGAKGPCGSAFDCSGLIKWVYINAGVGVNYFPDGSWIQADWGRRSNLEVSNEIGKDAELEVDKLEPGDVVFFKGSLPTDGYGAEELDIRHVGIYAGDGKIIEAAGRDYGVIESDISGKRNYRGAIRICSEGFDQNIGGVFSEAVKYEYEIELNKRDFITPDGIKSIDI